MRVQSPAKVNWTLRVLGRRPDGYHEIESLVGPVTLFDELAFEFRGEPGVCLTCNRPDLPTDASNLVVRAGALLADKAGRPLGAVCRLVKRIPVGGGLGGGSSNAAAALIALNRLWGLHWPTVRLLDLAAKLGSDVPLFLHGGPVIMRGRGERIEPATLAWNGWIALIFPQRAISTAAVYRAWRPAEAPADSLSRLTCGRLDAVACMEATFNMLEAPAFEVCEPLRKLRDALQAIALRPVRVSGSGSTLFTAFDVRPEAEAFVAQVERELGLGGCAVRPVTTPV